MERFPTTEVLASADEQDVLAVWQGLGYYRRCRMLVEAAKALNGRTMPETVREWRNLPGVGRYTAGAINSIAQGCPSAVVDGNVERVYARLNTDPAIGTQLTDRAWQWAERTLDPVRPGDWNQALMELGATVCTPFAPQCGKCPLTDSCQAFQAGTQSDFPQRAPAPVTVGLKQEVWVPIHQERFGVRQIPKGEWWQGMWEFPRADSSSAETLTAIVGPAELQPMGAVKHSVTRYRIVLTVQAALVQERSSRLAWLTEPELERLPMPSPQRKALGLTKKNLGTRNWGTLFTAWPR
jgi:A/G-specific adenine glycosylase